MTQIPGGRGEREECCRAVTLRTPESRESGKEPSKTKDFGQRQNCGVGLEAVLAAVKRGVNVIAM